MTTLKPPPALSTSLALLYEECNESFHCWWIMQNQSFVKLDSLAYIIVWWQNYVLMVLFVSCLKPCTWYMLVVTSKSYIIIWGHSPANAKVIACVAWCVRSVLLIRHVQLALSFSDQGAACTSRYRRVEFN